MFNTIVRSCKGSALIKIYIPQLVL